MPRSQISRPPTSSDKPILAPTLMTSVTSKLATEYMTRCSLDAVTYNNSSLLDPPEAESWVSSRHTIKLFEVDRVTERWTCRLWYSTTWVIWPLLPWRMARYVPVDCRQITSVDRIAKRKSVMLVSRVVVHWSHENIGLHDCSDEMSLPLLHSKSLQLAAYFRALCLLLVSYRPMMHNVRRPQSTSGQRRVVSHVALDVQNKKGVLSQSLYIGRDAPYI